MKENPFTKRSKILEENKDYLDHTVKTISKVFIEVIKNNGKLIFAGNGGSAAEAQHMSAEYVGTLVTSNKRNPIPSIALSTDTSFITAWSNDHGYEDIFRRQLQALANEKDCFVAYSTSVKVATLLTLLIMQIQKVLKQFLLQVQKIQKHLKVLFLHSKHLLRKLL